MVLHLVVDMAYHTAVVATMLKPLMVPLAVMELLNLVTIRNSNNMAVPITDMVINIKMLATVKFLMALLPGVHRQNIIDDITDIIVIIRLK